MTDIIIGNLGTRSSWDANYNLLQAIPATLGETAHLQAIRMEFQVADGNVTCGVYSDSSGLPGTLLASTADSTIVAGVHDYSTSTNPSLSAGSYWIVWYSNVATPFGQGGSSFCAYKARTYDGALPATFGSEDGSGDWNWIARAVLLGGSVGIRRRRIR